MNTPIVSVIIPTYNRAHLLAKTIGSVLNQTYVDFEVIIADDGSTDRTKKMVRSFKDKRLRYVKLEDNSGSSAIPKNIGLEAARGRYIAFLDSDDLWLPKKLEAEVRFLCTHPSIGMVYSGYTYFGDRGGEKDSKDFAPVSGHALKGLFVENPIISSAVLVRKSCLKSVGPFDEAIRQNGDLDMWLRIAACFQIDHIPTSLTRCRLHGGNRHIKELENSMGFLAVLLKCLKSNKSLLSKGDFNTMCRAYNAHCWGISQGFLSKGRCKEARRLLWESLALYDLFNFLTWLITFVPPALVPYLNNCLISVRPYRGKMKQVWRRLFLR